MGGCAYPGLTIVTRVLRNHGGEIFMDQPESGGTRVTVRLPVDGVRGAECGVGNEKDAAQQAETVEKK